jgi:UDP-N-acetylmuramoylalanine--D-glutamate ligase
MVAALTQARAVAQPGDLVLLSPACASFDAYESFEKRGEHFCQLVEAQV